MLKSIKKTLTIIMVTVAILVLLFITLSFIVRVPAVQTYIVNKVAIYISRETKSTVSVKSINFSFFNRLELKNTSIIDQNNDTLLYAPSLTVGIRHLGLRSNSYNLGKVIIIKPVIGLVTDSAGKMNLTWFLDLLQKPKDSTVVNKSYFHINQIEISDGRFSLINKKATPSKTLMDFNNLRLSGINAIVENLTVRNDSTTFDIYNLGFKESTGFLVKRMSGNMLLNNQNILFRDINIICDSSIINADHIGILINSTTSFKKPSDELKIDVALEKSLFSSNDLKYFLNFLKDYNESFWLSGDIKGTLSELKGRNIKMTYKDETYLDCDFDFSGLPDIDNTFMFIDIIDFRSISKDVEQIRIPGKGFILLPEALRKLGVVSFSGSFTGFTTDFVTYGKINTNKGIISTDISLRPSGKNNYLVKGTLKGSGIDLGSITGKPLLFGGLSMEANIDGTASSSEKFAVNLTGKVDSVEINNYKYRNIALNGIFSNEAWDGSITVEDENIHMNLLGMFEFNRKLPEFDFTLNLLKANLYKLNLDKADTSSSVTMLLTANFTGNSIDNLDGEIKVLNSTFRKFNNDLDIYDFTIKTTNRNNLSSISLRTDFIDANLNGSYKFSSIGKIVESRLWKLMPAKFEAPKKEAAQNSNSFIFDILFKNTDKLNNFLKTGIVLSENSAIQGSFFGDSLISVSANAKILAFNNNTLTNLKIDGKTVDSTSQLNITSSSFNLSGISELKDLSLSFSTVPNNFRFLVDWDNKEKIVTKGSLKAEGVFEKKLEGEKSTLLKIGLLPAEVVVRDTVWKINPSTIIIDSSYIDIQNLSIRNNTNYFLIDGAISESKTDTMRLEFNGISISPINSLYEKPLQNDPNMIRLNLGGKLNGNISFTDVYKEFMFESDIKLNDFTILGSKYGEIKVRSAWNNLKKIVDVTASNNFEGKKMFDITGLFDPATGMVNLNTIADKLPVDFLNPLLKMFASAITGTATGKLNFSGNFKYPVLTGSLMTENASMKIDFLQTKYRFSDSIRLDSRGIKFNNIRALDDKGNVATINGVVNHKYFKDFAVDLTINTDECMVLNTRPKDSDLFYGTAYASGITTIKSKGPVLTFDISAKTGKNTRFFIPLNTGLSVTNKSFINFINNNPDTKQTGVPAKTPTVTTSQSGMEINFDLEVTPDAEVQLIFDSKAGDVMKGTGKGNLNISLSKNGELKIYGDYIVEDGDYLFTLKNIFNKKFIVQSGGKISFNGDVKDADIDIKAVYKLKASLYDIMPGMLPDSKLKEKIPVECILYLSGNLFNPAVVFDIYLPTADEETRAYLKSMIKSDEEMSRQFIFLLVMNSFYADPTAGTAQSTANISSATVGVTTTEMVSNQISNWLSQISNDFDIGVNWRPGTTAIPNSQEVQVALSTQLLNDRIKINGNFDYGGSQTNTASPSGNTTISGAFDVEINITDKILFKVFNRSNDNFYINNGIQYTQGVGLFFRQDFNKFKDLFKKPVKSDMKKEKKTKINNK